MPSLIHNLDPESLVILHLSGELSPEDQARVDAMLHADPALREQYQEALAAQRFMSAVLTEADANRPLPSPQTSSARRVASATAQWNVNRLASVQTAPAKPARGYGWIYSAAAMAAMILITVFILWSRVQDGSSGPIVQVPDSKVDDASSENEEANYTPSAGGDVETQLASVETDLSTLSTLTDSVHTTDEAGTP